MARSETEDAARQRNDADAAVVPGSGEADARRLLELARELVLALHPHRRRALRVALNSTLDRDLGLDSLGRVELLLRVERAFNIRLGEQALAQADNLRDLLVMVRQGGAGPAQADRAVRPLVLEAVQATPSEAGTLTDVLDWHCDRHGDRPHIRLEEADAAGDIVTYTMLRDRARQVAGGLRAAGLIGGQSVAIMLPTGRDFFAAFFGVLYAGGVPVPIYPPFRLSQLEEHMRRQAGILVNAEANVLITTEEGLRVIRLLRGQVSTLRRIETVGSLAASDAGLEPPHPATQDIALLQYTSGSTGDPKGVILSHANLLANIRAMGEALEASSADVFVSWLPLYHDMGLIGAWLGSLYYGALAVIMSPLSFLARPERWLWAIHRNRATLSAAPNFAYELCLRKIDPVELQGLDLGSWRMAVNGAEPVSPGTVRGFAERFAAFGFRAEAMAPVYGLAECAVGLAFPPPGRGPIIDRVDRHSLTGRGYAQPAAADDAAALDFVACGRALPGHQIRIVDAAGREVEDRREGRLQFRGPSATRGYLRNPGKTSELISGDWLESGDLAYCVAGEVFLTGRSKDIIIRAGRNIYPHEVEEAVGNLPGIRRGCVVAFGSHDRDTGTERLIVVAETRETEAEERRALRRQIDDLVAGILEMPPDDVVLAPPHAVLKTSSGKIRRAACRELYENGIIGAEAAPVWQQIARLRLAGLRQSARRIAAGFGALAFAAYWWALLCVLASVTWVGVALLPRRRWRWHLIHSVARLFLLSTVPRYHVTGSENLPLRAAILAVNHSSYLDAVVLAAMLAEPPAFVVKQELGRQFVAGTLLRRIGALFVERVDPEAGVASAESVLAAARSGTLLVFFPEGTLTRMPGLLPFRLGAFRVAAEAGVPVVPVAIRGTRSILRGEQWFPRRGEIHVAAGRSIHPGGIDWTASIELRDAVRRELLRLVEEPDLAGERVTLAPPAS